MASLHPTRTRVYLSATSSQRRDVESAAQELRAIGLIVCSSWHCNGPLGRLVPDEAQTRGTADLCELRTADMLVAFSALPSTEHPGRGGRHVELGFALALGLETYLVGPAEHVFHYVPEVRHVVDLAELLGLLAGDLDRDTI